MNFKSSVSSDGSNLLLMVYDELGPEWLGMISAETFVPILDSFKGSTINVRINSPGGDVFEGNAIYNALVRHPAQVIVDVDGLAASAASVVAMAGSKIRMAANSMIFVHEPWSTI